MDAERKPLEKKNSGMTMNRRQMIWGSIASLLAACAHKTLSADSGEGSSPAEQSAAKTESLESLSFDEITERLKPVWREQHEKLQIRQKEVNARCRRLQAVLSNKKVALNVFLKRWNAVTDQFAKRNGMVVTSMDVYYALLKRIEGVLQKAEETLGEEEDHTKSDTAFHEQYADTLSRRRELEELHKIALMTDVWGRVELYREEQKKYPSLTSETYIGKLAQLLDTPERLALFIRYFIEYTHDSPDPEKDPLLKGTEETAKDFLQFPDDTLCRVDNGKYLGDCEDTAVLVKEILVQQRKKPFILYIPGYPRSHATCVCIEKNSHGKFDVFDFGVHGVERNGSAWGVNQNGVTVGFGYGKAPEEFFTGFNTPKEALLAILKKYKDIMSLDLEAWNNSPGFYVLKDYRDIPKAKRAKIRHPEDDVYVSFDDLLDRYVSTVDIVTPPPPELAMP